MGNMNPKTEDFVNCYENEFGIYLVGNKVLLKGSRPLMIMESMEGR